MTNKDTDYDGLQDGEEDDNHDGVWDSDEPNPLDRDSVLFRVTCAVVLYIYMR